MRGARVTTLPGARRRAREGLIAVAMGAAWAGGCGRIGYGLSPEKGPGPVDASTEQTPPPRDARPEAPSDARPIDAWEVDAPPEAPADAAPDATLDALDAGPEAEAGCPGGAVTDYCGSIPPMTVTPVIDGVLDPSPCLLVDVTPEFWSGPPPLPPFPSGNSTRIAAAWRPDGLYLFVDVTTPAAFPAEAGTPDFFGAGVELFLDDDGAYTSPPAYDNPGTIQYVVTAPDAVDASTARAEGYRNAADQGPWTSARFGTFPTPTGFAFEAFVVAADLGLANWPLAGGGAIGLDIAVDVSFTTEAMTGSQGHRVGQYFLHVAPPDAGIGSPFADPRAFCRPALSSM